ncbi:MAG: PEGA domain-containing protein, partial [Pseudomonadota bacterium]
ADKVIKELRKVGYQSAGGKLLDAMLLRMLVAKALNEEEIISSLAAEVVRIDPNINLETGDLPPSLAKRVEDARAKLFEAGSGKIKITSNPKSVELFINGVSQGMTPVSFEKMPVGEYLVTLKASHYEHFNQVVTLKDGKSASVKGKLKWSENAVDEIELNKVAKSSRLAGLLQADKLVLLSTNPSQNLVTAQVIDRRFSVAEKPVSFRINSSSRDYDSNLMKLADKISEQAKHDIEKGTLKVAEISPDTPATFFNSMNKPIYKRPLFWAGVGLLLGGLGGGLAIALSGGGSSTGELKVDLGTSVGK